MNNYEGDAYSSFSYLESGKDFPTFELAAQIDRVDSRGLDLTDLEVTKVEELLEENIVISLHDHPVLFPSKMEETPAYYRTGRQHTGFLGLRESKMTAVFDNMMDGTACISGKAPWRFDDIVIDLGMRQADIAHQGDITVVRELRDIVGAHTSGQVGVIFGLEAATPIENEIDRVDVLYGLGVRQMGIAYSDSNALGCGLNEKIDGGLTAFGERALRRMNRIGMAVDISHSSDQTALDVCSKSTAPVLLTHGGARAIWNTKRMKPDEVLVAIASTGGVVGISAAPHTTISAAHLAHDLESVMDHFSYCVDLLGIDHVGFGPDTLYGDHVALHTVFAELLNITTSTSGPSFPKVEFVNGVENPTENFTNICGWLVHHGFSDDEIIKVLGGNVLRVLQDIWF